MTLQEAAAELGVHYMTAYRYVRLGLLAALKEGGTWRVRKSDLDLFRSEPVAAAASTVAVSALSASSASSASQPATRRARRAPWANRLEQRLLAGDSAGAWSVMAAAMTAGASIEECYLDVLAPAMRSIGARWERGEIDIALEHHATSIAGRLIGRLGARTYRRGRSKGTVVLGAAPGERHSLPVAVLADLVRLAGWEIVDLGADVPASSFVHAASAVGPDLVAVGVSVTYPESLDAVRETMVDLRRALPPDVRLMVGGLAIEDDAHAQTLGADGSARDARSFVALLDAGRP